MALRRGWIISRPKTLKWVIHPNQSGFNKRVTHEIGARLLTIWGKKGGLPGQLPIKVVLTGLHFSIHSSNSSFRFALTSLLWSTSSKSTSVLPIPPNHSAVLPCPPNRAGIIESANGLLFVSPDIFFCYYLIRLCNFNAMYIII